MTQYLLSVYQPDGPAPDAASLQAIMEDVDAVEAELRATVETDRPGVGGLA